MIAFRRIFTTFALGLVAVGLSPATFAADKRPITWQVNGGYAETIGHTADYAQGVG